MRILFLGVALALAGCSQETQPVAAPAEGVNAPDPSTAAPALAGHYVFAGDNLTAAVSELTLAGRPVEGTA